MIKQRPENLIQDIILNGHPTRTLYYPRFDIKLQTMISMLGKVSKEEKKHNDSVMEDQNLLHYDAKSRIA